MVQQEVAYGCKMSNYDLKINKTVLESDVLFDCENDDDLIKQVDKKSYSIATIKSGAKVTYTVTAPGYENTSNTLIMDKDYELTPELKKWVVLTIETEPVDSTVIIEFNGQKYKQKSLKVLTKTPITYTVSRERRQTISDTVVLNGDLTIKVELMVRIETDKDIGDYEGKTTDELSEINLLNQSDYDALSEKDKAFYVKYSFPSILFANTGYNSSINDALVNLYWSLPIMGKLAPFTNGSLGRAQCNFIDFLGQINSIMATADDAISILTHLKKALRKVGLGSLTDVFMTIFNLISAIGGLIYALLYNPDVFISAVQQTFKDIDPQDLLNRTVGSTLPNLEYAQGLLNRMYIPDGSLKDTLYDEMQQIFGAAEMSIGVFNQLKSLEMQVGEINNSEQALIATIEMIATMGISNMLGSVAQRLRNNHKEIRDNLNNNQLSDAVKVMEQNLNKIVNGMEDKYINIKDLEYLNKINRENQTSSSLILDYQKGYEDGYNNALNGESDDEMEGRLNQFKKEYDKLNKDSSSYIAGYRIGHEVGKQKYIEELNGAETKEQLESYQKGYEDGYIYGKQLRELAIDELNNEEKLNPSESEISMKMNELANAERARVETKTKEDIPAGYINPYYSRGWNDGYETRNKINQGITDDIIENQLGNTEGYAYARDNIVIDNNDHQYSEKYDEPDNDINQDDVEYTLADWINNYKLKNPNNYVYRCQGVINGYNKYQSEYNLGYSMGWTQSMRAEDYEPDEETPEELKKAFLENICITYNLNYDEQISLDIYHQNSIFRGAIMGWNQFYNGIDSARYRDSIIDQIVV